MKLLSHFLFIVFAASFFIACESDTSSNAAQIDDTATEVKGALDMLERKAKKFLDEGGMDKVKEVVDEVAVKSKEINEDSPVWKEKLNEVKNDKEVQDLVKNYEGDGKALIEKLTKTLEGFENEEDVKAGLAKLANEKEIKELLKKHEGDASKIFQDIEGEIEGLKNNPVLKKKFEQYKNDPELKELFKKYEQDGKDILKKVEDIFKSLEEL